MAELRLSDMDVSTLERLEARAAAHRRSVAEEIRLIVHNAINGDEKPLSVPEFIRRTQGIRQRTAACPQTDSAVLVREDRER